MHTAPAPIPGSTSSTGRKRKSVWSVPCNSAPAETRTLAKLALARGYATLERLSGAHYSENAAALLRVKARDEFMLASLKAPTDPAPRIWRWRGSTCTRCPIPEKAMAEFAEAQRLGAPLGRREVEQQGDVYRIRAQQEYDARLEAGDARCRLWRAASTGGFPASMKRTGTCASWTGSTRRRPASRAAKVVPWR